MLEFREEFLFGASTSAHGVEGGNFGNDWWRWEQRPGRIRDGATSQPAADHYARFESDFDLARRLGHRAHLFSVEWSRVEPEEGVFDEDAVAHYAAVLDALAQRGIEPICALHHVTAPAWFAARYGWHHPEAATRFARFVRHVAPSWTSKCRWWTPILEPMHFLTHAYLEGRWPPGVRNPYKAVRAMVQLAEAHAQAYCILHAHREDVQVGLAVRGRLVQPLDADNPWDLRTARREQRRSNRWMADAVVWGHWPFPSKTACHLKGTADFIGVSYYGLETVRFAAICPRTVFTLRTDPQGTPCTSEEYAPRPEGLYDVLQELAGYGLPLLVTGNGIATEDDADRCAYLLAHLAQVHRALRDGIDVRGYIYRSFLDGFEWTEGYTSRYGLVHVDRNTLARTPNPSAYLFKDICETGALRPGMLERFYPTQQVATGIPLGILR